jgi:Flp pilus assembly protein TadB
MDTAILPSTLLLTLLMLVGLIFFIRASTKDRIETAQLVSQQNEATFMSGLKEYFQQRGYRVAAIDSQRNQVTFEGFVKPSVFLAVFLTLLAAVGLLCLTLVILQLFPNLSVAFAAIVLLSPLSGLFYWKKSGRLEKVSLFVKSTEENQDSASRITVVAHRDELAQLQSSLNLQIDE